MATTNQQLRNLRRVIPGLSLSVLMDITQRSKTLVYGWLQPQSSRHHKVMADRDLRLLKLELGLASPRYAHLREPR